MPGGVLCGSDWDRLRDSAIRVSDRFYPRDAVFVELGIYRAATSWDLIEKLHNHVISKEHVSSFRYIGVDPDCWNVSPRVPDPRFTHIKAPSYLALDRIPQEINWCFVDSCHCALCVRRDIELYADRLAVGGELLFHDASPLRQGGSSEAYAGMDAHHDPVAAKAGVRVREVLDTYMVARHDFKLILRAPEDQQDGGVEVYEKVST